MFGSRRPRETKPKLPALRKFLLVAVVAVGAQAAAAASTAAAIATGDAFQASRASKEGRGEVRAGGIAELSFCGREAVACTNDAECSGCSAMAVGGWDGGKVEELAAASARGGGGGSNGIDFSGESFFEARLTVTRCEKVGATICGGLATVGAGVGADAAKQQKAEEREGGGLNTSLRVESCRENRKVQALLACRVRAAGCEPDDAPCVVLEKHISRRDLLSSDGERSAGSSAREAPWHWSEDVERARSARAMSDAPVASAAAAAGATAAAADVGGDPEISDPKRATRRSRRLATTSSEPSCDGIQNGSACCSAACGECGGFGCSGRGTGAEDCCTTDILDSGVLCSNTDGAPPCIVDGEG